MLSLPHTLIIIAMLHDMSDLQCQYARCGTNGSRVRPCGSDAHAPLVSPKHDSA